MFQPLPSRQPHSRSGSPMNGVLEGRARLAGGETTGSSAIMDVAKGRAPAGAREACANPTSAVLPGAFGRFSRPSRALSENAWVDHAHPVVAPPAHVFRASGTFVMGAPAWGSPISGVFPASVKRQAISNLNPVLSPR